MVTRSISVNSYYMRNLSIISDCKCDYDRHRLTRAISIDVIIVNEKRTFISRKSTVVDFIF